MEVEQGDFEKATPFFIPKTVLAQPFESENIDNNIDSQKHMGLQAHKP